MLNLRRLPKKISFLFFGETWFGEKSENNCNPTDYKYLTNLRVWCSPCAENSNIKAILIRDVKDQEVSQWTKQKLIFCVFCMLWSRMMKLMKSKSFKTSNLENFGVLKMQNARKVQFIVFARGNRLRAHRKHPLQITSICVLPCKSLIWVKKSENSFNPTDYTYLTMRRARCAPSAENTNIKTVLIRGLKDQKASQWTKEKLIFAFFAFCGQGWWNWWNQKISKPATLKYLAPLKCKKHKRCNWFFFHV